MEVTKKNDGYCTFIEEYLEFKRKTMEKKGKIKRVNDNIFPNVKSFFEFMREEKGVERMNEHFFDESRKEQVEEFVNQLGDSKYRASTKRQYCFAVNKLIEFCVAQYKPISESEERKANAGEMCEILVKAQRKWNSMIVEERKEGKEKVGGKENNEQEYKEEYNQTFFVSCFFFTPRELFKSCSKG